MAPTGKPMTFREVGGGFKNLTDYEMEPDIKAILSYGPKFIPPNRKINPINTLVTLNSIAETVEADTPMRYKEITRGVAKDTNKYIEENKKKQFTRTELKINETVGKIKEMLTRRKDIKIIEADKGKVTVAVHKEYYEDLLKEMITEGISNGLYRRIDSEDIKKTQKAMENAYKNKLKAINTNGLYLRKTNDRGNTHLSGEDVEMLRSLDDYENEISILHPVIKIHKEIPKLRPIVSKTSAINTKLGKYINRALDRMRHLECLRIDQNVKDKLDLLKEIKTLEWQEGHVLVTMDIKDMYNNLDLTELKRSIKDTIGPKMEGEYNVTNLLSIVDFDLKQANYFQVEKEVFKQTRGTPMGGKTSGKYASLYIDLAINRIYGRLQKMGTKLLKIYVDDFLIYAKEQNIKAIQRTLEKELNMELTVEKENDMNEINYLDLTISRTNKEFRTRWYKKTIASNRLINYLSNQPNTYKRNTMIERVSYAIKVTETEHIENTIRTLVIEADDNGYPRKITEKYFSEGIRKSDPEQKKKQKITAYLNDKCGMEIEDNLEEKEQNQGHGNHKRSTGDTQEGKDKDTKKKFIRTQYINSTTDRHITKINDRIPNVKMVPYNPPGANIRSIYNTKRKRGAKTHEYKNKDINTHKTDPQDWNNIILFQCRDCNHKYIVHTGKTDTKEMVHKQMNSTSGAMYNHKNTLGHRINEEVQIVDKVRSKAKAAKYIAAYIGNNDGEDSRIIDINPYKTNAHYKGKVTREGGTLTITPRNTS